MAEWHARHTACHETQFTFYTYCTPTRRTTRAAARCARAPRAFDLSEVEVKSPEFVYEYVCSLCQSELEVVLTVAQTAAMAITVPAPIGSRAPAVARVRFQTRPQRGARR